MEDSKCNDSTSSCSRLMNPWVLHFQKLGLELKCALCLKLLNQPTLLRCNHIFCNPCIPNLAHFGSECPVCKIKVSDQDLRPAPFMENIVAIYKSLDASFCANLDQPPVSPNISFSSQMSKEPFENGQGVRVPCGPNQSVADRVGTKGRVDNRRMTIDGNGEELELARRGGMEFNVAVNPNSPLVSSQVRAGGVEECMTIERDMNQGAHSFPSSPPSFGDAKASDNDSCDLRCEQISENSLVKRSIIKIDESGTGQMRNDNSASETDGHLRDLKRQKKLNYEPEQELKSRIPPNESLANSTICAFCQLSTISEVTGPMLHYSNGKPVVGDKATVSNVIHVHKLCIDWAPQVFYVEETVKNLKAEVARGAKLRCSKCGLKGAALGCYVKSCRRSYHVPCAIEISKCRWDHESYLLLCPVHCSVRFPKEKLNSEKHENCQLSNSWVASNGVNRVFCPSGLSPEEKLLLCKFAEKSGAIVSKNWTPDVTHVIAAMDEDDAYVRTFKVLMAMLAGRWVLKIDWVKACMEAMYHVDEVPYEVSLDNYGCQNGPKTGRLRALNNDPKLFNGLNFYFAGDFVPDRKEDLQDLIIAAGGTVFISMEEILEPSRHEESASRTLVVYNLDPPPGCKLGEEVSILWQRSNEADDVAAKTGSQIIGHTWLLESIARCELQPIVC